MQTVVPLGRLACSAFSVQPSVAGQLLLARTLDYYPEVDWWGSGRLINSLLRQTVVLLVTRPLRGYAFLSVGWPGFLGAVTGLHEAGLAIACLTSTVPGETPDSEPAPPIYRRILEEAATLDEAEVLRAARRTIGNNLLVVSAQDGAARLLEFTSQLVAAVEPADGRLVSTTTSSTRQWRPSSETGSWRSREAGWSAFKPSTARALSPSSRRRRS